MDQTNNKNSRTLSLPKLFPTRPALSLTLNETKLFQTNEQLTQTKKLFLDRVHFKEETKAFDDDTERQDRPKARSFIQFPNTVVQEGFTSFKQINKSQTSDMLDDIKNLRAKSTCLKPFVKAEILLNKAGYEKIQQANIQKQKFEQDYLMRRLKQLTPTPMKKQIKIRQKLKNKTKNIKKITLEMNYKLYEQNLNCWKPFIDFDALVVPIKEEVFFIGGRKETAPIVYNIGNNTWKSMENIQGMKCFGETDPIVIDHKIYCFGGQDYFQQGFSLMNCNLKIIDMKAKRMEVLEFSETKTPIRSFHSQCVYGKFLIISGGIDKFNRLFNTFMNYHIDKKYWNQLSIKKMPDRLKLGFAKHCTLPIFHHRSTYSIYDNEDITTIDPAIQQEGIYIFGGEDGNGDMMGAMYIMRLGNPSVIIEELKIDGVPPVARRNARMIRHNDYIILHGGRNDEMKPSVLNSMHFLHLKKLAWIKVGGEKTPFRYSHCLTVINDEIVIFGGKGLEGLSKQICIMPYSQTIEYV